MKIENHFLDEIGLKIHRIFLMKNSENYLKAF